MICQSNIEESFLKDILIFFRGSVIADTLNCPYKYIVFYVSKAPQQNN